MSQTQPEKTGMDCIVIGGCASGLLLREIKMDATWIELKRPDHIKPLKSAFQDMPEIMHESDKYEVHPISLVNSSMPGRGHVFGIAVVEGKSLTWAFGELVKAHVENVTMKLRAANLVEGNA